MDMHSGTGSGLVYFLDYAKNKGLLKASTAKAYRSAVTKVLAIDDEDIDITALDIEGHFERFVRISGDEYTPGSLATYKARFSSAVDMYLKYLKNPSGFKAPVRQRRGSRATDNPAKVTSEPPKASSHQNDFTNSPNDSDLLTYPFPLRSGRTAYLRLPRHLTTEDVERMSTLLQSLAIDPPLQLPAGAADHRELD